MIKAWIKTRTTALGDFRIFRIRSDEKISPRTNQAHEFFILDCVNWVNVVALTPDRQLVMVEQYRHGSNTVELEIPGGMMDATDPDPVAGGPATGQPRLGLGPRGSRPTASSRPRPCRKRG